MLGQRLSNDQNYAIVCDLFMLCYAVYVINNNNTNNTQTISNAP